MKTKNIIKCMIATIAMLASACTSEMPEYIGTNVSVNQSSYSINPKLDGFDYTAHFNLWNLASAQNEEISEFGVKIKFNGDVEEVIFLKDVKVSELDENNARFDYTFKDLNYNESYQFEYSYTYRSDLGFVDYESNTNTVYINQDKFYSLINISSGIPYDVGLTYATIPVHLNVLDECVEGVGIEYSYESNFSSKSTKYVKNITEKTINISIGSRRVDKPTYYRCYVMSSDNSTKKYTATYTLNIPAVDESIAVDLGLSVNWAPFNIGSKNESDKGWYYYPSNYWGSYLSSYGYYPTICGRKDYDTALSRWGNNWQMPDYDQIEELRTKCMWEKVSDEICNGYKVTGPNGNSIFIPVSGYYVDSGDRVESQQDAIIISGDFKPDYDRDYSYRYFGQNAYGLKNGQSFTSYSTNYYGYQVRAVLPK